MFTPIKSAIQVAADEVTERNVRGGVEYIGIPTGFRSLDVLSGGLRKGELYIIGARTGMGKSSMALTIAKHQCSIGCRVAYLTLEMSAATLAYRWIASELNFSAMKIERGIVNREQLTIIQHMAGHLEGFEFLIDDSPYKSTDIAQALKDIGKPIDVLYVDYLTLLRDEGNENESARLAFISGQLKNIAMTLDIPVVCLVQLNREVEKRSSNKPIVSDIRGSGGPEMDAGFVALLYRPAYYEYMNSNKKPPSVEDDAEIIVVKNRFGPMGNIPARFHTAQMRWESKE